MSTVQSNSSAEQVAAPQKPKKKGKLKWIVLAVIGLVVAVIFMASGSSGPLRLEKAYIVSSSVEGHRYTQAYFEFLNTTDKRIESFKGQVLIYDKSSPDKVNLRCDIDYKSPIDPNEKLYLLRSCVDDAPQQEMAGPAAAEMLEETAKALGVSVFSL